MYDLKRYLHEIQLFPFTYELKVDKLLKVVSANETLCKIKTRGL